MEDVTIVLNDVDEGLVEYFEYVVYKDNLLYPPTNEGRTGTINIYFGKVKHTIINKKTFLFLFYIFA